MGNANQSQAAGTPLTVAVVDATSVEKLRALHATLRDAVTTNASIVIDCSATSDTDLRLVQLLLSARKTAQAAGKQLTLAAPGNGALLDALKRGGFVNPPDAPPAPGQDFWPGAPAEDGGG